MTTKKQKTDVAVVENNGTEVVKQNTPNAIQDFNPERIITQAIANNTPVETMEKLLAMRRELKQEYAKEQFDIAMANFQAECPIIAKTRQGSKTKSGEVAFNFAPLENIVTKVKPLLTKHGFSYSILTETKEGKVIAQAIAKHIAGHSDSSSMEVPLGGQTGVMSATQVVAAAITFAKRYAFCNVFGIITGDTDSDDLPPSDGEPEKKPEEVALSKIQRNLLSTIEKSKDKARIIELDERAQESSKFSPEFKAEVKKLANAMVAKLDK